MGRPTMPVDATCPRCGVIRPENAAGGLCPRCLLRLGFGADLSAGPDGSGTRSFAVGNGLSRVSGFLSALDEAVGPVPRVLLRDGLADDPRPVRPPSEWIPDLAGAEGRYQPLGEISPCG